MIGESWYFLKSLNKIDNNYKLMEFIFVKKMTIILYLLSDGFDEVGLRILFNSMIDRLFFTALWSAESLRFNFSQVIGKATFCSPITR